MTFYDFFLSYDFLVLYLGAIFWLFRSRPDVASVLEPSASACVSRLMN